MLVGRDGSPPQYAASNTSCLYQNNFTAKVNVYITYAIKVHVDILKKTLIRIQTSRSDHDLNH